MSVASNYLPKPIWSCQPRLNTKCGKSFYFIAQAENQIKSCEVAERKSGSNFLWISLCTFSKGRFFLRLHSHFFSTSSSSSCSCSCSFCLFASLIVAFAIQHFSLLVKCVYDKRKFWDIRCVIYQCQVFYNLTKSDEREKELNKKDTITCKLMRAYEECCSKEESSRKRLCTERSSQHLLYASTIEIDVWIYLQWELPFHFRKTCSGGVSGWLCIVGQTFKSISLKLDTQKMNAWIVN